MGDRNSLISTSLPYRRVLGTLAHIVSMIDHGSVRIARSAAVEMIEEIRRVQAKPQATEQPKDALEEKPWFEIEQAVLKKVQDAYEDEDTDYLRDLIFNAVREVADAFGIPKDRRRIKQAFRVSEDTLRKAIHDIYGNDHDCDLLDDFIRALTNRGVEVVPGV